MLPAYSGPQLPFLNSSGQKDRKPTALTHYRSALCKTQTKKEVKEKSVTPILSGPQGSPFLVLWTERQDFSEFQLCVVLMCQLYQEPTLKTMSKEKAKYGKFTAIQLTSPGFDSFPQSACFSLLSKVLRELLFAFHLVFLDVISRKIGFSRLII